MIVYANSSGRLGNKLTCAAHLVAFADEHGIELRLPDLGNYAQHFPGLASAPWCTPKAARVAAKFGRRLGHRTLRVGPYQIVGTEGDIRVTGELQLDQAFLDRYRPARRTCIFFGMNFTCWRGFYERRDVVRHFFRPQPAVAERAREFVEKLRGADALVCTVHVRRTDYKDWNNGRYYYEHTTYRDFMRQIAELHPDRTVRFVVCSDEPFNAAHYPGFDVRAGLGGLFEDVETMANSDVTVGPPSTFSTWAMITGRTRLFHVAKPKLPIRLQDLRDFEGHYGWVPSGVRPGPDPYFSDEADGSNG